jgi:hypothetical protein
VPLSDKHRSIITALAKQDLVENIAPPTTCECCGAVLPTHADAMNIMLVAQVGVPGHPAIPGFQCPMNEHWACSIECWVKVAQDCIKNDMVPLLEHAHERVGRQNPVPRKPSPGTRG